MRIRNAQTLAGHGNRKMRADVAAILEAGMTAGDPYGHTRELVRIEGGKLRIGGKDFEPTGTPLPGDVTLDLAAIDRIYVFGAGKGIQRAAEALEEALGDRLTGGHIILKYGDDAALRTIGVTYGGHPIPDEGCVKGCETIARQIKEAKLTPKDVVFTIIGNGVSSLLTLPAGGLSLEDIMEVTRVLQIEKGAPTRALNMVRNSVDLLKGGRITRMLYPAQMFHILTIDCNTGMSGKSGYEGLTETNIWLQTLPDASSAQDALEIIHRYEAWDDISDAVKSFLQAMPPEQESLKKDEFERMGCRIYGVVPDRMGAMPAAFAKAEELGYAPYLVNRKSFDLDAAESGKFMAYMADLIASDNTPFAAPCALFMGGEKVVKVGREGGVGGRNQEFCVAAASVIAENDRIAVGSVDTDGTDGPGGDFHPEARALGITALAGAIVDGTTKAAAKSRGHSLENALLAHDTSPLLWDIGDAVWATHSISVQDLTVVLVGEA
ncbi:MAG: D-glycerate 2-kinase [Desulfovibrio sp.]